MTYDVDIDKYNNIGHMCIYIYIYSCHDIVVIICDIMADDVDMIYCSGYIYIYIII